LEFFQKTIAKLEIISGIIYKVIKLMLSKEFLKA